MSLIQTPFDFHSTADQVLSGVNLAGKRAIVTGASSGIGVETARALARAGAHVTLAVRNVEAGERVAAEIAAAVEGANVTTHRLDLAEMASVQAFCDGWSKPLHILVNNAGIMASPGLERTGRGWEGQFATNYLGHFALTLGLKDAMAEAAGARVVCVSSSGHLLSPVIFDDPHFRFLRYDPLTAYGQSKTACVLMAVEIARRWGNTCGIQANALNPGAIPTGLQRHVGGLRTPEERRKTIAQGASTSVLLAASPLLADVGGRYFEDCNEAAVVSERPDNYTGVAAYALDAENALRLWEMSLSLLSR
jgi:NAD(P)-dependent dehydrogenase (short-subunit alcohol dehydrogenase family)